MRKYLFILGVSFLVLGCSEISDPPGGAQECVNAKDCENLPKCSEPKCVCKKNKCLPLCKGLNIACSESQSCCPDVGCFDLKTDKDNCGACGQKCESGQSCKDGSCVSSGNPSSCDSGERKCEGDKVMECVSGAWTEKAHCQEGCEESTKTCKGAGVCGDGEISSDEACDPEHVDWKSGKECSLMGDEYANDGQVAFCSRGCEIESDRCTIEERCNDAERRCSGDKLEVCGSDKKWKLSEDCSEKGRSCNSESLSCVMCVNGAKKCEDGHVYVCNGGEWGEGQVCESEICENDDCKAMGTECKKDETKCVDKQFATCIGGFWSAEQECPDGGKCEGKVCNKKECSDGAKKCEEGYLKVCTAGVWPKDGVACDTKQCEKGGNDCKKPECTHMDRKCEKGVAYNCQNKMWTKAEQCETGACDGHSCLESQCKKGEVKCDKGKIYKCGSKLQWDKGSACKDSDVCKSLTACGDCKVNESQCASGKVKRCSVSGVWSSEEACKTGKCKDAKVCADSECKNGATKCAGGKISQCVNGAWGSAKACETKSCKDDKICKPKECEKNEMKCTGDKLYKCKDFLWDSGKKCEGGQKCDKAGKKCESSSSVPDITWCQSQYIGEEGGRTVSYGWVLDPRVPKQEELLFADLYCGQIGKKISEWTKVIDTASYNKDCTGCGEKFEYKGEVNKSLLSAGKYLCLWAFSLDYSNQPYVYCDKSGGVPLTDKNVKPTAAQCLTLTVSGGGSGGGENYKEDFNKFSGASSSYNNDSFTGNHGIKWSYKSGMKAKSAQQIEGNSLVLKNGTFSGEISTNGIKKISVQVKQAYTGGNRKVYIKLNGSQMLKKESEWGTAIHTLSKDVNLSGKVKLEIITKERVSIDNIEWSK